jgi:hypothetical protein
MTLKVRVYVSLSFIAIFLAVMMYALASTDLKKKFAGLMREHAGDRPFYCHFTSVTVRQCMSALGRALDLFGLFQDTRSTALILQNGKYRS